MCQEMFPCVRKESVPRAHYRQGPTHAATGRVQKFLKMTSSAKLPGSVG